MSQGVTRRGLIGGMGGLALGAVLVPDLRPVLARDGSAAPPIFKHVPVLGTRVSFAVRHPDPRLVRDALRAAPLRKPPEYQ